MKLEAETRDNVLHVRVAEDRLDAEVAIQFKDRFRELLDDTAHEVVLDLTEVGFLDSSGLGAVVAVLKLTGPGRRLVLTGLTPPVQKVFKLTRMDTVFHIEDSRAAGPDTAPLAGGGANVRTS